eukprot:12347109-Alexandrium_andersonii.AAC.1
MLQLRATSIHWPDTNGGRKTGGPFPKFKGCRFCLLCLKSRFGEFTLVHLWGIDILGTQRVGSSRNPNAVH